MNKHESKQIMHKNFIVVLFNKIGIVHSVAYRDIESARNHQNNVKPDANLKGWVCCIYEFPYEISHNHQVIKNVDFNSLKMLSRQTYN